MWLDVDVYARMIDHLVTMRQQMLFTLMVCCVTGALQLYAMGVHAHHAGQYDKLFALLQYPSSASDKLRQTAETIQPAGSYEKFVGPMSAVSFVPLDMQHAVIRRLLEVRLQRYRAGAGWSVSPLCESREDKTEVFRLTVLLLDIHLYHIQMARLHGLLMERG